MGLARTILLAASTSSWLRDRATKTDFVRRSVSSFMPGERLEDAIAVAVSASRGMASMRSSPGSERT